MRLFSLGPFFLRLFFWGSFFSISKFHFNFRIARGDTHKSEKTSGGGKSKCNFSTYALLSTHTLGDSGAVSEDFLSFGDGGQKKSVKA